jgi:acetoacetyl-CoA synthetase
VLFAIDSYSYKGKHHDRCAVVNELLAGLPSVERVVQVAGPLAEGREVDWRNHSRWESAVLNDAAPHYERLAFEHPLWILYSSGTTGLPKAMVHSQGGILLTHLKEMGLQNDLRPGDRLLFLGSTSWAVWNLLVGAMVTGASIVLYDGHPSWPDGDTLWRFMNGERVAVFGCGAAFLIRLMKDGLRPRSCPAREAAQHPVHGVPAADRRPSIGFTRTSSPTSGSPPSAGARISPRASSPAHRRCRCAAEIQCAELGVAARSTTRGIP